MKKFVGALAMLTLVGLAAPAEARMRAGMLNCTVAPSVGYIVGSQKAVTCRFNPVSGRAEKYRGRITKVGLDVGFTNGGQITWAVYTAAPAGRGALAGSYGGALHLLKAVAAMPAERGGRAIVARMKAMPTDDDAFGQGSIRIDGRKLHPAYLLRVKAPAESHGPWDYCKVEVTVPADQAFRPLSAGGCPLVHA